jgi:hypothetical protein
MVGIILAARRYVNGEVHHFRRDRGFLIKVAQRLGVKQSRWEEIERACSVGVVPLGPIEPL